jgi:exopolysaccharide biosynthesis WecB/TagA/CpsF family protein
VKRKVPHVILGVPLYPVTLNESLGWISEALAEKGPHQVVTANLDFARMAQEDPEFKRILLGADLVVADGMPLVWLSRFFGDPLPERVTGADMAEPACRVAAADGRSVYLLGAAEASSEKAASVLRERIPGFRLGGRTSPPVSPLEELAAEPLVGRVRESGAELLLCALGSPKQDKWIARVKDRSGARVSIGVGASLDFLSGFQTRCPRMFASLGIEWVWRFLTAPTRLGGRYAADAVFLLAGLIRRSRIRWGRFGSARRDFGAHSVRKDSLGSVRFGRVSGQEAAAAMVRMIAEKSTAAGALVDLSALDWLTPLELGVLVSARAAIARMGGALALSGVGERTHAQLEAEGLLPFLIEAPTGMPETPRAGKTPKVSAIVVNYNAGESLERAVGSLSGLSAEECEVIVVDNGSTDGSLSAVERRWPRARIVRAGRNLGFAGGNNLGLRFARGEIVLLFNPDARTDAETVRETVRRFEADPAIGVAGIRLEQSDGELSAARAAIRFFGEMKELCGFGNRPRGGRADWVCGAYFAVRREALAAVGSLDERYFMYAEEADFCHRVKRSGWTVASFEDLSCEHEGGVCARNAAAEEMTASGSQLALWREMSRFLYLRKNHGVEASWMFAGFFAFQFARFVRRAFALTSSGKRKRAEAISSILTAARAWKLTGGGRISPPAPWPLGDGIVARRPEVEERNLPRLARFSGVSTLFSSRTVRFAQSVRPVLKRGLDLAASGAGLIVLAPLFAAVAAAIKLESPGPVFFSQERVGRWGRRFRMWKFRSMRSDAEALKKELQEKNEMAGGVIFKMKDDPRITRVGRLIRKLSIDELPQLWNVFTGDMSLVGPRPPVPSEVAEYSLDDRLRLDATPGITCIWQVSGRSEIPFDRQVEMDVRYIHERSLWTDLSLLVRTIPAVLSGKGAY